MPTFLLTALIQAPDLTVPDEGPSLGWQVVKMFLLLGVVVLLAYLTLNVGLRKLLGVRATGLHGGSVVSVIERVSLDPKRTLFVLKAGKEYLLVGAAEGGMQLLTKLEATDVEAIQAARASAGTGMSPFLQKLLSRRGAP